MVKNIIFPPGSTRERVGIEIKQAIRLIRRDGLKGLFQYISIRLKVSRLLIPPWWLSASNKIQQSNWDTFKEFIQAQKVKGISFIIAATPYDLSEGQRSTWLARAMLRADWAVVYAYWRWSPDDIGNIYSGGRIFQIPIDIAWEQASNLFTTPEFTEFSRLLLIEFPHPCLFSMINVANITGWVTWYDRIDDWAEFHKVGQADWFDSDFEHYLSINVLKLSATTEPLADELKRMSSTPVKHIPNGYEAQLFSKNPIRNLIGDTVTVGYFGQLTTAWFDWELLFFLADRHLDWKFELIGPGSIPLSSRKNIFCIGKIPHHKLIEYAQHWNAGLIPFRSTTLSHSVDPIKIYEYLAFGLPVVVSGIPHLKNMPYVAVANNYLDFNQKVEEAVNTIVDQETINSFLMDNTWDQRSAIFLSNTELITVFQKPNHQSERNQQL